MMSASHLTKCIKVLLKYNAIRHRPMEKVDSLAPIIVDGAGGDRRLRVGRGVGADIAICISRKRHARFAHPLDAVCHYGGAVDFMLAMATAKVLLVLENSSGAGYWLRILRLLRAPRFTAGK